MTAREVKEAEFERNINMKGEGSGLQKVLFVLFMLTSSVPALAMAGFEKFRDMVPELGVPVWIAISAAGGGLAMALFYPEFKYWYLGVLPGLVAGPLAMLCTYWYGQYREKLYIFEIPLPFLVGILPSVTVYYYTLRWAVLRDDPPVKA
jgi:hypothetical protein